MRVVHVVGTIKHGQCGVGDFVKFLDKRMGKKSRIWHPQLNEDIVLENDEIIHLHTPSKGWRNEFQQIQIYSKFPKRKRHLTLHEWGLASFLRKLQYFLLSSMSKKIGFSDSFELQNFPYFNKSKTYLPIGSPFEGVVTRKINPKNFRLVFFGFLSKSKDVKKLSEWFNQSVNLGWDQPVVFTGNKKNALLRDFLARCEDVELRQDCSFEEISQQIKWGDVGILPFVDGTSPRRTTLLSLLKMGIPVISPPPYKNPFKTDDFPRWNTIESLRDMKKRYLYWTKKQNKIIKIFDWENVVKKHLNFYED
tara:strand:+ start:123 stop:1043 length:921 start_codon:yes stop_codon:yes gene_type:complete